MSERNLWSHAQVETLIKNQTIAIREVFDSFDLVNCLWIRILIDLNFELFICIISKVLSSRALDLQSPRITTGTEASMHQSGGFPLFWC